MLCLKQRDGRRTDGSDSVTYQEVWKVVGESVTRKPIETPAVTQLEDSRSKNETPPPVDKYAWRIRREGEKSNKETP